MISSGDLGGLKELMTSRNLRQTNEPKGLRIQLSLSRVYLVVRTSISSMGANLYRSLRGRSRKQTAACSIHYASVSSSFFINAMLDLLVYLYTTDSLFRRQPCQGPRPARRTNRFPSRLRSVHH
jgi:hypothetical protein